MRIALILGEWLPNFITDYWIREDTILKIVYALSPGAILELPIYNFNVSVGSIFTTYSFLQGTFPYQFQVTLIDSIQINNGTYRKRIHATCNTPPCVSWWPFSYKYVEGIGSLDEPIGIFYDASDPEFYLKCFNQNLTPIYTAGAFICPPDTLSILGLGDNKEMSMNIYPNPASSKINISFAQPQKNIRIKLFNLFGQELQEFHQEMGLKIEFEFIPTVKLGVYLLEVQTTEGQIRKRIAIR